ncbi:20863_t:CDS:2, partial [Dentiscutata erythropus]
MDTRDEKIFLGVQPPEGNTSTSKALEKTTTLIRVLEFPTFFLFTTYKQQKHTIFTESIIDNPEYAVLVTFNSINISYNTRKFTAVAQTFDIIPSYLQQKRIKQ